MMTAMDALSTPVIKLGSTWEQCVETRAGKKLVRRIEVIGLPTLSSPVNYRVLRNDAHPHRKGKTGSIRRIDLYRKYAPES